MSIVGAVIFVPFGTIWLFCRLGSNAMLWESISSWPGRGVQNKAPARKKAKMKMSLEYKFVRIKNPLAIMAPEPLALAREFPFLFF